MRSRLNAILAICAPISIGSSMKGHAIVSWTADGPVGGAFHWIQINPESYPDPEQVYPKVASLSQQSCFLVQVSGLVCCACPELLDKHSRPVQSIEMGVLPWLPVAASTEDLFLVPVVFFFFSFFNLLLNCSGVCSYPAAVIPFRIWSNTGLVRIAPSSFAWTWSVDHIARRQVVSSTDHCCFTASILSHRLFENGALSQSFTCWWS